MFPCATFFFEGKPRLTLFWDNPNIAATVLVSLVPILWGISGKNHGASFTRRDILIFLFECISIAFLTVTFSRGAELALIVCVILFGIAIKKQTNGCRQVGDIRFFLASRMGVIACVMASTGLLHRFSLISKGDASALHRISLWKGGLLLIAINPAFGWGVGSSGFVFSQWAQEPSSALLYGGMVNSYLELAVDFGLFSLLGGLCTVMLPMVLYCREFRFIPAANGRMILGLTLSVIAFAISALFTTVWTHPTVLLVFVCVFIVQVNAIIRVRGAKCLVPALSKTFLCSGVVVICVFCIAHIVASYSPWTIRSHEGGVITMVPRNMESSTYRRNILILPDWAVLGRFYGKQLRLTPIDSKVGIMRLVVAPPGRRPSAAAQFDLVIAFGARVGELANYPYAKKAAIFPSGRPDEQRSKIDHIFLPEYDENGVGLLWKQSAGMQRNCKVTTISDAGSDLRDQWSKVFTLCVEELCNIQ